MLNVVFIGITSYYYKNKIKGYVVSEPRLEDIEDYDGLKGKKKKVVWGIVIAGLLISVIYGIVVNLSDSDENISDDKTYKTVPMR